MSFVPTFYRFVVPWINIFVCNLRYACDGLGRGGGGGGDKVEKTSYVTSINII